MKQFAQVGEWAKSTYAGKHGLVIGISANRKRICLEFGYGDFPSRPMWYSMSEMALGTEATRWSRSLAVYARRHASRQYQRPSAATALPQDQTP
jgi:hypothetical protein